MPLGLPDTPSLASPPAPWQTPLTEHLPPRTRRVSVSREKPPVFRNFAARPPPPSRVSEHPRNSISFSQPRPLAGLAFQSGRPRHVLHFLSFSRLSFTRNSVILRTRSRGSGSCSENRIELS